LISLVSGSLSQPFAEGFWLIELNMRHEDATGRRYLCHARNNREAFRIGERLKASTGGVLGFACHRLEPDCPVLAQSGQPRIGGYAEVTDSGRWDLLNASRFDPTRGHNRPSPKLF
jgi:hypothetical protein